MAELRQIKTDLLFLLLSIFVLVAAYRFSADSNQVSVLAGQPLAQICWFKSITGIECPTCGLSRSTVAWLDGNFSLAWQLHPLSILLLVPLLVQIPYRTFVLLSGRRIRIFSKRAFIQCVSYGYIGLFVLNWLIRILNG